MLRPEDAKKVFQKSVTDKLLPMSVTLVKAFEEAYYSKEQLEKMRGTDSGQDLNADGSGGSLGLSSSSGSDLLTEVLDQTKMIFFFVMYFSHVHKPWNQLRKNGFSSAHVEKNTPPLSGLCSHTTFLILDTPPPPLGEQPRGFLRRQRALDREWRRRRRRKGGQSNGVRGDPQGARGQRASVRRALQASDHHGAAAAPRRERGGGGRAGRASKESAGAFGRDFGVQRGEKEGHVERDGPKRVLELRERPPQANRGGKHETVKEEEVNAREQSL